MPRLGLQNMELVLTDTDSFILHVKNMERDEMLTKLEPIMDFSNYPTDSPFHSSKNKGKLGYFKDENAGTPLQEVIALKSKCYLTRNARENEEAKCKGIDRKSQKHLTRRDYLNSLYLQEEMSTDVRNIQCVSGKLFTSRTRKIALCPFDDKRWIQNCGIHSIPHGSNNETTCSQCNLHES